MNAITYPTKVRWIKEVTADPLDHYGKKNREKIRAFLKATDEISVDYVPLTDELLKWFQPLYEADISSRENPATFDVRSRTLNHPTGGDYWMQIITEAGNRIGATIFSVKPDRLNLAFKVFPHQWPVKKRQASPSFCADYFITQYAREIDKQFVSYGMDRNPYGPNASIGLAVFKLSIGCYPYLPTTSVDYIDLDLASLDENA